jgi:glyoxylase-like metal-dependent hydrolase (beta-lactamase superfamily II)
MTRHQPTTQRFDIGGMTVTKIIDTVESFSPKVLYVDKDRSAFDPHLDWLQPHFVDANKAMRLSIHSFIIQTRHHRVLVDTCIGNHKQGSGFPQWNDRTDSGYLTDLAAAGLRPEDIDYVFCTHMHVDHTGWNTRLKDGRWVPTFPNARYLFNRREWAAWEHSDNPHDKATMTQNVLPIIEAGQVQWVDNNWAIDDQVELLPTPGHTPGHCSVRIAYQGASAVITGDMMIHPVQIAEPGWHQTADADKALAARTRQAFVDHHCDRDVMILGTHFHTPTGVYIVERNGARRVRLPAD